MTDRLTELIDANLATVAWLVAAGVGLLLTFLFGVLRLLLTLTAVLVVLGAVGTVLGIVVGQLFGDDPSSRPAPEGETS